MVISKRIKLHTKGDGQIIDITDAVAWAIRESALQNGIVVLFTPSSTSALTTLEYEPGVVTDLSAAFEQIAPAGATYEHHLRWGDGNGHSHVRAALMGPSLTVPFIGAQMTLGDWQQIVFVDFDNKQRQRQIIVQILGEA